MRNYLELGTHNAICDRCGFKHNANQLRSEWTGLKVCCECWESRHPQDLIKVRAENPTPPWTRPEPIDAFVERYNLINYSEFTNGLSDLTTATGLLSLSSLTGYDAAVSFGYNGSTNSVALMSATKYVSTGLVNGDTMVFSVIVSMTDGLAPSFGSNTGTDVSNDFFLRVAGQSTPALSYVITALPNGLYRVSGTRTWLGSSTFGVEKSPLNSTRTFKVTGWQIEKTTLTDYQKMVNGKHPNVY